MDPCLVLVAGLCLSNADRIEINASSIGTVVSIQSEKYSARLNANSDNVRTPDWSRMSAACGANVCVAYFKHCRNAEQEHTCEYHFSQPGEFQNTVLVVSAASQDAIEGAEKEMGVFARNGLTMAVISLTKFSLASENADPPYCPRKKSQTACWPKGE